MNKNFSESVENRCPRCATTNLKTWRELTDDEQLLATKLPFSAEFTLSERKRHVFCTRCWYEISENQAQHNC